MAKIIILRDTFSEVGKNLYGRTLGTVCVDMGGRSGPMEVPAVRHDNGDVSVAGFVGRYRTSQSPWQADVKTNGADDRIFVHFGRDDRSGRFNKQDAISYEPETFETVCNPQYWEVV